MARILYGASPADYVINGTTGLPAPGVSLDVYDAAGGSPIIDLKGVSGATYGEGSTITSLTSNSIGMFPFYGPDGTAGTLYLRGSDGAGGYLWYGVNPTNLANMVATLSGTVATLATAVAGFTTPTSVSADTIVDGTTNHAFTAADDTKLTGIATGATANLTDAWLLDRSHQTGSLATSVITGLDAALAARVVNMGGFNRVWGRTTLQGFPQGSDGALDGDWLAMDEN